MVLDNCVSWRDRDLMQICPFLLSGVVIVELSPDGAMALSARASETVQSHVN